MPGMPLTRASRAILADLERDPEWFPTVLTRIACGDKWSEICKEYCVLEGAALAWIYDLEHPQRKAAYDHALKVRAEMKVHEALDIVDDTEIDVQRAKLRAETRLKVVAKWDKERYGGDDRNAGGGGVQIIIQKFADEKVVIADADGPQTVQ